MIPETPVKAVLELRRSTADFGSALLFGQNAAPDPEFKNETYFPEGRFGTDAQGDVGYDVFTAAGVRRSSSAWRLQLPVALFRYPSRGAAYIVPVDVSYDETTGNVVCLALTDFDQNRPGTTADDGFGLRLLRARLRDEGTLEDFASVALIQQWTANYVPLGQEIPYTCVAADGGYAWIGKLGESADGQTLKAYDVRTGAADTSRDRVLALGEGTTLRGLDVTDGWEVQVLGVKAVWRALTDSGSYREVQPEHALIGEWTIDPKLDVAVFLGLWGRRHPRARVKALSSGGGAPYLLEVAESLATVRDVSGTAAHVVNLPGPVTLLAGPSGLDAGTRSHEMVVQRRGAQLTPPFITEDADGAPLSVVPGASELVLALDRRSIPAALWSHDGQIVIRYESMLYLVTSLDVDDEQNEAIARVRVGVA